MLILLNNVFKYITVYILESEKHYSTPRTLITLIGSKHKYLLLIVPSLQIFLCSIFFRLLRLDKKFNNTCHVALTKRRNKLVFSFQNLIFLIN